MTTSLIRRGATLLPLVLLAGCNTVVMNPSGDIAAQQGKLIVVSTLLMLIIIVPVIALTVLFAWRYRKGNTGATYAPDWDHSTALELVIWGAPLLIIIALGLLTWISTHTLDPYRPLQRLDANRPVAAGVKPLNVQVVALDWKWLFIYPDLGIATVNVLAAPVDVPVRFKISASNVMNSFYIPALAGQIYAMPGMETTLNAVINRAGVFDGFSANYSGAGFSDMRFKFHGMAPADFERWVQATKGGTAKLDRAGYQALEKPSERDPVRRYGSVEAGLFDAIVNRCVDLDAVCMNTMMAADANRGKIKAAVAKLSGNGNGAAAKLAAAGADICVTPTTPTTSVKKQ
ncbi:MULTISPECIES: ubiquinol oxidase subunit II [unclassified Janthinobacterium]|uniref:ubiquinol oxidase subunit II n=1 Tax=unclassified Janthinobacterium TaxID=2610881 RepID=UPI0003477614|nr:MULTISPECIES: ubiquinol oxidase subunit II [unclassified Janthinobacterium]MEC5161957.1 cytochrome o ubiquinol oxidase subunit 2 [Janthinobacterium sp. CG_S6]